MKHPLQQILLFIISLVFTGFAQASHCYSYTVKGYYSLLAEEGGIFLQETIKDHNEISYVSQEKARLRGVTDQGFQVVSDDGSDILFTSEGMYYLVRKSLYMVKEYDVSPLFREDEVSKIISNQFFLVSGNWYYVASRDIGKSVKHKIPELKGNLEIIADFNRGEILLKDDHAVYVYYQGKNTLKKIPKLTPSQTHLVQSLDFYGQHHYLYDDDTFYLTTIRFIYSDITKQFNLQGKHEGLTKAEIHTSYSGDSIDTKDGLIWLYAHSTLPQGENSFFTPVQATYLNAHKDLYLYHDKVYADNWDLIQERNPVDLSIVKNPDELHRPVSVVFSDNLLEYNLSEHQLRPEEKESSLRRTKDYIEIQEGRIFIGAEELSSDIFKDVPIFLGSIVNVIEACDDGRISSVAVDYYYFFTDGKNVYAYLNPWEKGKPKVLHNISPQGLKADDYGTLQKLMNMLITP